MAVKDGTEKDEEVVCEFFGIKITTKNPNVARVLTSDISKVMNLDVKEVKSFLNDDQDEGGPESPSVDGSGGARGDSEITAVKGSFSGVDDLNKLLGAED